jgi:L-asparaginase II
VHAMTGNPFLVGGTERFDTALMLACRGRVLCKIGAEGVHTLALVDRGIGLAVKVEDGAPRAQYPAVLALLAELGELPDPLPESLREFAAKPVRNTRGESVGEIRVSPAQLGATGSGA